MENFEWARFLQDYNAEILASDLPAGALQDSGSDELRAAVNAGWLGFAGATDEQLSAAEQRLRVGLPPDYRAFLENSNGWLFPGVFVPRLWPVKEVGWFRDTDPESVDLWSQGDPSIAIRLRSALRISDQEIGGTAVYLLVPPAANGSNHWEASMLAGWIPGERTYPSYQQLMQAERRGFQLFQDRQAKRLPADGNFADILARTSSLRDQLREKARLYRSYAPADLSGIGVMESTAASLGEVADEVEALITSVQNSESILSELRTLQQRAEARHRALHELWGPGRGPQNPLHLIKGAREMARGEGLRHGAAIIAHFLRDA